MSESPSRSACGRGALTRLLQLASPALPIGAYSYSSGLEAAIDAGIVSDEASALAWIRDVLELVLARFDAPLIAAAMDGGDLVALDDAALAARETAELRLEATQMAYSLSRWIAQVAPAGEPDFEPRSLQVAWAVAAMRIGVARDDALTGWLWGFAENQVMVLIKALPIGQIAGQRMLYALGPMIDACARNAGDRPPSRWSNAATGLALASMRHERQYSRLFRS